MAISANTKTLWLLLLGAVVIAILILPLRFTPVVPQGIDALPVQARAQLIQKYEQPARELRLKIDTLKLAIRRRYGGTTPSQDSMFAELTKRADQMLQITDHLRNPHKATYEETRQDVSKLLERLHSEADLTIRQLLDDFLR